MQLPRGTFREIKKAELISSMLDDLEQKKFSGICSISSGPVSGTLVFKSGKCILAKILHKSGDGAWEELQKMGSHEVDAALSSLDEAQVQLALEFNKPCRILKSGKTAPSAHQSQKPADTVHREPAGRPVTSPHTAAKPAAALVKTASVGTPPLRPSSSFTAPPAPQTSKPVTPSSTTRTAPAPAALPQKPVAHPPAQPLISPEPAAPAYITPQIPVHHAQEPKKPAETEAPPRIPAVLKRILILSIRLILRM